MLYFADAIESIFNADSPLLMFILVAAVAVVAILAATFSKVVTARSRERTRREIAAYVAEGSIDPDKAIAMLNAGEAGSKLEITDGDATVVIGAKIGGASA